MNLLSSVAEPPVWLPSASGLSCPAPSLGISCHLGSSLASFLTCKTNVPDVGLRGWLTVTREPWGGLQVPELGALWSVIAAAGGSVPPGKMVGCLGVEGRGVTKT